MNFLDKIDSLYLSADDNSLFDASDGSKLVALYLLYHYFNADETKLFEVTNSVINRRDNDSFQIKSIIPSCTIDDAIDFVTFISEEVFNHMSTDSLLYNIKRVAKLVGDVYFHTSDMVNTAEQIAFDDLSTKLTEDTTYVINVLCGFSLPIEQKIEIQQLVSEISVKSKNVIFGIIFEDDIQQEIDDIDSPKECVPRGVISLMSDDICRFGEENSFVTLISAKSLKQLFYTYSTRGLFASNLRFYVTSKKIDAKIVNSIQNESEDFCYYNNGIIITCDDYRIINNQIILSNFSIVNGGQTTNLIGRTPFNKDFGIICKVIKSKYEERNKKIEFLSKVAEASNTQKPIKAKDLIANRIEQRKLKIQFAEAGMFLKVKRGEKIDKQIYPEAYMNASNEEVAQMVYAYVYQAPGAAKNGASTLLSNDKTYDLIFKKEYNSDFYKSIQFLKVAYSNWQKRTSKYEPHSSVIYGLSKHSNFLFGAIIGFFMKLIVNDEIKMKILTMPLKDINGHNDEIKNLLKVNDIGLIPLIRPDVFDSIEKNTFNQLIDFVVEEVLVRAYNSFKKKYPNYAFSQFGKADYYYYEFVLPVARSVMTVKQSKLMELIEPYFNITGQVNVSPTIEDEDQNLIGLENELKDFRSNIVKECKDKSIKAYNVFKTSQLGLMLKYFPRNDNALRNLIGLNEEQIEKYGASIIKIVSKYIKTEEFE